MTTYATLPVRLHLDTMALLPSILLRAPASSGAASAAHLCLDEMVLQRPVRAIPRVILCVVRGGSYATGSPCVVRCEPYAWASGESPGRWKWICSEDRVSFT